MPVYNNPALGQAFSNIAQLFAPPSGSDLAGYAAAKAKNEEASRFAQLYANPTDPLASKRAALLGIQTYGATPEGFGMEDATKRYGIDVGAKSAAEVARINGESELQKLFATPVTVAENATTFLPGQTSQAMGLPGVLRGNVNVGEGEITTTPDGQVFRGAPKPLTKEQVEGDLLTAIVRRASAPGAAPAEQRAAQVLNDRLATGNTGVEKVIQNGQTVYAPGGSAAMTGMQAAPTAEGNPDTKNYKTPEGEVGSAIFDPVKKRYVDMQTGADLPAGSITFSGQLTGNSGDLGIGKRTDRDNQLDLISSGMMPGVAKLNEIYRTGATASTTGLMANSAAANSPGLKDIAQSVGLIKPQDQAIFAAMNSFMDNMYLVTGAARPESENAAALAALTPLASDTPETKQLKWDTFNQKALALAHQSKDPAVRDQLLKAVHGIFVSPATAAGVNENVINRAAQNVGAPVAVTPAAPAVSPPDGAIMMLKANPSLRADFDAKYGPGASAQYLGGQ